MYLLLTTFLLAATLALARPPQVQNRQLGPSLSEFLETLPSSKQARQIYAGGSNGLKNQTKATVEMCTLPDFSGQCYTATLPINKCIWLNGFAGQVLSFKPAPEFECMLMQGECDGDDYYLDFSKNLGTLDDGDDLRKWDWINETNSYLCFKELSKGGSGRVKVADDGRPSREMAVNLL